ncbi:MAG: TIM barrel protein [Verrucomicrobia bacterium]|nr:MAG: TIM barrel protein [Verrucomicrobiota bacterium]
MIAILVGTNRPGSNTARVARHVASIHRALGAEVRLVDLGALPADSFGPAAYGARPDAVQAAADVLLQADGLVVVTPEYNGGLPGALKYFIDLLPFPASFERRPVCFVGLAAGQWGALRPIEQLQAIFGYRNAYLYPERVFIPGIHDALDADGNLADAKIDARLRDQAAGFQRFVRALPPAPSIDRLGVCSWSLQPASAAELVSRLAGTGVRALQLHLDPLRENPAAWADLVPLLESHGIRLLSGMMTTVGEDYTTLDTIRITGGVVPDATWEQNWENFQADIVLAKSLGLRLVTLHAGFLPHDDADPSFAKLLERIGRIADLFARHGLGISFETGQEDAPTLRSFLVRLNRGNVGVNFDPANMLLYDKGDPVAALRELAPWIRQVHLKDATRTATPGTWGAEVVVGTGEVDWVAFHRALRDIDFRGHLCLEREAGTQRVADLAAGAAFVRNLKY